MKRHAIVTVLALLSSTVIFGLEAVNSGLQTNATSTLAKRINDGQVLNPRGFGYIVYIHSAYATASMSACTGVLISSKYVLTMQSCLGDNDIIMNKNYSNINVTIAQTAAAAEKMTATYRVANAFTSSNFQPVGYFNHLAILQLENDVPEKLAPPRKIYAGDYKTDTPVKLAGFATNSTQDSKISISEMRYEYLHIGSNDYCLGGNSKYSPGFEICAPVTSGVSTCNGDFGAPLLTYVNNRDPNSSSNGDSVIVETNSNNNDEFAGYALLGLTNFAYNNVLSDYIPCVYGGHMAYFTWLYPYIDHIANLTGLHVQKFTVVNSTKNNSPELYMHPEMAFPIQLKAQENRASRQNITPVYITVALGVAALFTAF